MMSSQVLTGETRDDSELLAAAVGPQADYYLDRWRTMDAEGRTASWNWPACLFNMFWFGWRKMWLPMLALLVVMVVLAVIGAARPQAAQATFLVTIAISFVTGAYGNHLYRRQTRKLIAGTAGMDREARIAALRARGGVSLPALVVTLGLLTLLAGVAMLGIIAGHQARDGAAPAAGGSATAP